MYVGAKQRTSGVLAAVCGDPPLLDYSTWTTQVDRVYISLKYSLRCRLYVQRPQRGTSRNHRLQKSVIY